MVAFVVLVLMISCAFVWLAKTGVLMKIHKALNLICSTGLLYTGLIIIVSASVFKVVSGMELALGELLSLPASNIIITSNVVNGMGEMADTTSNVLIYLGLFFSAFSFLSDDGK